MHDLYALTRDELTTLLQEWGQPSFRADQLWGWMYDRGATSFDEMTNLPKALRGRLVDEACLADMQVATEQTSSDGTVKRLYRLRDGQLIEAVLMPYDDGRRTACVSSQAGCAMGCVFCATGQMGFARHLTAGEIFGQAARYAADLRQRGERLSNIVLMGMGEPFHNYDHVLSAIHMFMDRLGIGARHITVSTVGLAPMIRRFADEGLQVKLALSLHATTDDERRAIMPVARKWDLVELVDACRYYQQQTKRRFTLEWALIAGTNDKPEQAHRIGRLFGNLDAHVNLIPLNPTPGFGGQPSDEVATARFVEILAGYGLPATVRVRRGLDIDAGCGQLKSKVAKRGRVGGEQP